MNQLLLLLCFIFNTFLFASCQFLQSDPVRFEIHEIVNCKPDSEWTWTQDVRILNDTHAIATVAGTMNSPFDNTVSLTGEFKQFTNNNWKYLIKLTKKKACSTLKQYAGSLFNTICKEIGLKNGNCPVPMGTYGIKDKVVDYSQTALSKFLAGRFKGKVFATTQAKVILFCVDVEFSSIKI